jgi:uncharacterized protein (DUF2132 family)
MTQENNPLHGITLEKMLVQLVEQHGWVFFERIIVYRYLPFF